MKMTRRHRSRRSDPPIERFLQRLERQGDCLVWTGGLHGGGYGWFWPNSTKRFLAHRWAYEQFVGPIPDGFQIDHLCRNRACVNVMHLEAVTQRENILRGMGPAAVAVRTETCQHGHVGRFFLRKSGKRRCGACYQDEIKRASAKVSAQRAALRAAA